LSVDGLGGVRYGDVDFRNQLMIHPSTTDCHRTRLASSGVAAVDVCQCGGAQLHVGPITLRLTFGGLEELHATLGRALAEQAVRESRAGHLGLTSVDPITRS